MAEHIEYTLDEFERLNPLINSALLQGYDYCVDLIQFYSQIIDDTEDDEITRDYIVLRHLMRQQLDNYIDLNDFIGNMIPNNIQDHIIQDGIQDELETALIRSFSASQTLTVTPMVDFNIQLIIKNKARLALPSDSGKCVICYGNCFEEENPEMVVAIPCGEVHDVLHVECFRTYAGTSPACPLCRKDMSLELDKVVEIANKIMSESMIQGIELSNITIHSIQSMIKNLIEGRNVIIAKFLALPRFSCIVSWKDLFTIIGCEFNEDESRVFLPHESKSNASLFSDALTLLHP